MTKTGNVWIYEIPARGGFRVFFRPEPGAKLKGSRVYSTREAAEVMAAEIREENLTHRRTVEDAIKAFHEDNQLRGLRVETVRQEDNRLRKILGPVLPSPLADLTERRADSLYTAVVKSGAYGTTTHHRILETAKTFATWCMHPRRGWFKASPFAGVERIGKREDCRSESLRVDEARTFRSKALELATGGDEGAVAALVALVCSLRPSEIVQLEARDVDDGGALLWIDGARLKEKNTRRPVAIADPELQSLLVRAAAGKAPSDLLLGKHDRDFVADSAKRVSAAAGVPLVDARMLRRTFASLAARRGRSLDDLSFSMGHGVDGKARTAVKHYVSVGAVESGAGARAFAVLDGGKGKASAK